MRLIVARLLHPQERDAIFCLRLSQARRAVCCLVLVKSQRVIGFDLSLARDRRRQLLKRGGTAAKTLNALAAFTPSPLPSRSKP